MSYANPPESADLDTGLAELLARGISDLGLAVPAEAQQAMLAYLVLLARWNRVYNLTAIRAPGEMVIRHLLDSLSVARDVTGPRVLDVGTGAGLPGIPLALAHPEWQFVLLDSNAKKTRFVTQAAAELHFSNVGVVTSRVESYRPAQCFGTLICRAFGSLTDILAHTRHLYCPGGGLVAMKGEYPATELQSLPPDVTVAEIRAVTVPGLAAQRHMVRLIVSPNLVEPNAVGKGASVRTPAVAAEGECA